LQILSQNQLTACQTVKIMRVTEPRWSYCKDNVVCMY